MKKIALALALALAACSTAPSTPPAVTLNVTTENGSAEELQVADQLRRLASQYDLSRWVRSNDVVIEQRAIPHSAPVVTLNTLYLDDDDSLLAAFLHEQGHRYLTEHRQAAIAAAMALGELYPDAPDNRAAGGSSSQGSTWMHLMICLYESDALHELLGAERAQAVLGRRPVYPWVYQRVATDHAQIREIMAVHGLDGY